MEEQIKTAPQTDVEVVDIQFRSGQKIYFFDPDGQRFADGDHIIIDTARGEELGICVGGNHKIPPKNVVAPLRKVLRRATPQDERTIQENRAKEKRAFEVCQQKIAEHGLDMQLVNAEVAFAAREQNSVLFHRRRVGWISGSLVKDLASCIPHPHRTAPDRRSRTRPEWLAASASADGPSAASQFSGRFPASFHQNGKNPEPFPEPHQNFRHLRAGSCAA